MPPSSLLGRLSASQKVGRCLGETGETEIHRGRHTTQSQLAKADLEAVRNHTVNNHGLFWPQLPRGHSPPPTWPARGLPSHPLGNAPSPASNEMHSAFPSMAPPLPIGAAPGPGHTQLGARHSGWCAVRCREMVCKALIFITFQIYHSSVSQHRKIWF